MQKKKGWKMSELTAKQEDDMLEEARDRDFNEEDLPERDESVWADDPEDEDGF